MAVNNRFEFGTTFAIYTGTTDTTDLHQHAAYQLVSSSRGRTVVIDGLGREHCGESLLIRPLVPHATRYESSATIIYFDPQSAVALELANAAAPSDIAAMPSGVAPFDLRAPFDVLVQSLRELTGRPASHLDQRLAQILEDLARNPGAQMIGEAAVRYGVSEPRLRALVRSQFGVPLSTWLIWRKLERSARELVSGASFAEAALAGGFSDQAHFTRAMRRMFGLTPTSVARALGQ